MLRAMDSAVAGLRAHQNKLDVIGHNIANVNTFGFKSQIYSFQEAMYQTTSASTSGTTSAGGTNAAQFGYGALMGTIATDMTASTPTYMGGLNASINGEGFFITYTSKISNGVAPADMKKTDFDYTRVGQFKLDSNGYLVDGNGRFVYGFRPDDIQEPTKFEGNLVPLRAPKDLSSFSDSVSTSTSKEALELTNVQVNKLGEITAVTKSDNKALDGKTVSLGKLAIATFQNPEGLTKKGQYYYGATESDNTGAFSATIPGGSTSDLMAGYLEASNVDLATEFSNMITTQRGFQANSKMITVSDEILNELVNMKR
ncbi:MAG: flagellar hook-basal body complex protein [Lachnospiraceae bacterium]|nr:flagellar hook-basal body complex protein [Lachnospiraceae bacterium]